ncbi:MAG: NAD(P)H-hydrate dehydratase [Synechococcales cyanobacterium C42_A2020_086]|jgi:NAD(P)H-hydrate epimerase|nr:NAD(P)H-hydrate dehydratase [Synechococcales cyanobacterium C42_A2020_086]
MLPRLSGSDVRVETLQRFVVTAAQMSEIESRVFAAGMPVAALMEKVGGLLTQRIQALYPLAAYRRVGVLVGPGHNGGDALVVARELHLQGYRVQIYQPLPQLKQLTEQHARYAASLGIPRVEQPEALQTCDVLIDGLFGFGLTRPLDGAIAMAVETFNQSGVPILSIDLPSGVHTDTGAALGTAIRACQTLCLGLWKRAFLQDQALEFTGTAELIDFGLPLTDIEAVLGTDPALQRLTPTVALASLPLLRPASTHKYQQGHLLLVAGSRRYMGAALLAGLAARASGVGMLSIAVPESLRLLLIAQLPDALVIGCNEDETGAIAQLPADLDLSRYDAVACGPGMTPQARPVVEQILESDRPLILDADGLNILASLNPLEGLPKRAAATILTPHLGEFKRLFPNLAEDDRIAAVQAAAQQSQAVVLLKGARTAIAAPTGQVWLNPESTPALARGGSGDVLTGLLGGLVAQGVQRHAIASLVYGAAWWHAQAGLLAARERTLLGVDPSTLIRFLIPALSGSTRDHVQFPS